MAAEEATAALETLADVAVSGVSTLVRVTAELAEHDAVPFLWVVKTIAGKIVEHAQAVSDNEKHVVEAGRRAAATQAVLDTLQGASFPATHPAYVAIVEALAQMHEYASKWGDKSYWSKRFGVSLAKCTMKSIKYKELFELQFQVPRGVGWRRAEAPCAGRRERQEPSPSHPTRSPRPQVLESYLHLLTNAIVSEVYAELKKNFEAEAEERDHNFRQLVDAQDRATQSVEELQQQIAVVSGDVIASEQALSQRLASLESTLVESLKQHRDDAGASADAAAAVANSGALSSHVAAAIASEVGPIMIS